MSRTDKDRPYWVQLRDPLLKVQTKVSHTNDCDGWCTPTSWPSVGRRQAPEHSQYKVSGARVLWWEDSDKCYIWTKKYKDNGKIYGRVQIPGYEGRNRGQLLQLRHRWLSQDLEDIDSTDGAPVNHRYVYNTWDRD